MTGLVIRLRLAVRSGGPAALAALTILVAMVLSRPALAGSTEIAVAANFTDAAKEIASAFEAQTGHKAELSFGSTGTLYTQISQGAPFEVFLAADEARPRKAVEEEIAVKGSAFTYAIGKIVLYSADASVVKGAETLRDSEFDKLAIANPKTAPYGAAAVETMKKLGVYDALKGRIVEGTNIAQAFQFVETGNAELGFVALSQVAGRDGGSRWDVPGNFFAPIRQDAVLLNAGKGSEAAEAFMDFLRGPQAAAIIRKYGYDTGAGSAS